MENKYNNLIKAFKDNNIEEISKLSESLAKDVTLNLIINNIKELKDIYLDSADIRDTITLESTIKKDRNYYLGYIHAYENIARMITASKDVNENIHRTLLGKPEIFLAIKYLKEVQYASVSEISKHIKVEQKDLINLLESPEISKLKIIDSNSIGNNKYYYLNNKGKHYCNI